MGGAGRFFFIQVTDTFHFIDCHGHRRLLSGKARCFFFNRVTHTFCLYAAMRTEGFGWRHRGAQAISKFGLINTKKSLAIKQGAIFVKHSLNSKPSTLMCEYVMKMNYWQIPKNISSIRSRCHCSINLSGICRMSHRPSLTVSATNGFVRAEVTHATQPFKVALNVNKHFLTCQFSFIDLYYHPLFQRLPRTSKKVCGALAPSPQMFDWELKFYTHLYC